ncbi:hypothetical protein AB0I39_07030 [Kitasatospora purpeofusca]|uniref:hypothetical protein n=1 Tax=Kitasatospora purpeofusca TaxID=67352 RepID=UPI00340A2F0B
MAAKWFDTRHAAPVLMNLLPGLRELRTPLATGYIWLFAIWFLFRDQVPARPDASGIILSAYQLKDLIGLPAVLGACSFVAYIIGLAQVSPSALRDRLVRVPAMRGLLKDVPTRSLDVQPDVFGEGEEFRADDNGPPPPVSHNSLRSLRTLVRDIALEADPDAGLRLQLGDMDVERTVSNVLGDLRTLSLRLQVEKADLFQEFDRLASEATFRVNVGLAAGGLSVSLALAAGSPWFCVGVVVVPLMIRSGIYRQQSANDLLIETLTSRVVGCPVLVEYDSAVRTWASPPPSAGEPVRSS